MITTGKKIYELLKANQELTQLVGSRIYPLIIPEGTVFPCVIYERLFSNNYSKDYLTGSTTIVNITIIALKYSDSLAIAEAVAETLTSYKDSAIKNVTLTDGQESYESGTYIQMLTFKVQA